MVGGQGKIATRVASFPGFKREKVKPNPKPGNEATTRVNQLTKLSAADGYVALNVSQTYILSVR